MVNVLLSLILMCNGTGRGARYVAACSKRVTTCYNALPEPKPNVQDSVTACRAAYGTAKLLGED